MVEEPSDAASVRTAEVETVRVELGVGRVLTASRFTDPATGRDIVTLAEGWPEDGTPLPGRRGEAVELPASALPDVVAALRSLEGKQ